MITPDQGALPTITPTLVVTENGGAIIRFADFSGSKPVEWDLTFDGRGKLIKASHSAATLAFSSKPVPATIKP